MRLFICILTALMLCACAQKAYVDKSTEQMMNEGISLMNDRKYARAAQAFERVILNAENPTEAQLAQKFLADTYYAKKDYLDAIAAYEVYYDLYYPNDDIPHVIYRIGLSYVNIANGPRQDPTYSRTAEEFLTELRTLYPEQFREYNAAEPLSKVRNTLARHEYEVARYYLRIREPKSAIMRLQYLIGEYPETSIVEDAYVLLMETALKVPGYGEMASDYLDSFRQMFPGNSKTDSLSARISQKVIQENS